MANLQDKQVAILTGNGFEQVELTEPRQALDDAGATTHIVSPFSSPLRGWDHTDWGDEFEVNVPLTEANPEAYDLLLLPGGVMNPDSIRHLPDVKDFIRHFFTHNKPVAAICHAPWSLIDAEIVDGRKLTSYHSIRADLVNAGANWVNEPVVIDANLITSRNPDDLDAFVNAIIEMVRDIVPEDVNYRERELEASNLSEHNQPTEVAN